MPAKSVTRRVSLASPIVLVCSVTAGAQPAGERPVTAAEPSANPLRVINTANLSHGSVVAFANPPRCDQDGNVYLLLAPYATIEEVEAAKKAGRELPLIPREVLRLTVDGKKRTVFDPTRSSKFRDAKGLQTLGIAVDKHGTLFLLVWANWSSDRESEKISQHVVAFNEKGEHQSDVEIDWREIIVHQFEVFGSGQFLLRGRHGPQFAQRTAIFSVESAKLQDVSGWSGDPSTLLDDAQQLDEIMPRFDYMDRGSDGWIYVAEQDAQADGVVVCSVGPHGYTNTAFELQPTRRDRQLMAFRAAGDRFAAVYLQAGSPSEGASGDERGRWQLAIYNMHTGDLESQYGPAPAQPLCYQRIGSQDRFTFLIDGDKLVTMAP